VGARQATQVPAPSHWTPPIEHGLPAAVGWLVGTSLTQTSLVHGLLSSTGTQGAPPVPLLLVVVALPPVPLLLVTVELSPVALLPVALPP